MLGMARSPWGVVTALALAQVALAWAAQSQVAPGGRTYVFTPLVDVVPGGVPLTAGEAGDLAAEAKNQVDARDIQKAFARLGSNMSLDDLLRGVETLDDLTPRQKQRIAAILDDAKQKHADDFKVQQEILDLEAQLSRQEDDILAALPEDQRQRVQARAARR
jgi:hypothetical protein